MARSEFDYTTKMIRTNLSNFSAWHNRTKLILRFLAEEQATDGERKKILDEGGLTLVEVRMPRLTEPYRTEADTRCTLRPVRPITVVLPPNIDVRL